MLEQLLFVGFSVGFRFVEISISCVMVVCVIKDCGMVVDFGVFFDFRKFCCVVLSVLCCMTAFVVYCFNLCLEFDFSILVGSVLLLNTFA